MLIKLDNYESAQKCLEAALKIHEQHYGKSHPHTATMVGNLGIVFKHLGEDEKARQCYQQNITVFTKHYGANHPETARVKYNLTLLEETSSEQKSESPLENSFSEEEESPKDAHSDLLDID